MIAYNRRKDKKIIVQISFQEGVLPNGAQARFSFNREQSLGSIFLFVPQQTESMSDGALEVSGGAKVGQEAVLDGLYN